MKHISYLHCLSFPNYLIPGILMGWGLWYIAFQPVLPIYGPMTSLAHGVFPAAVLIACGAAGWGGAYLAALRPSSFRANVLNAIGSIMTATGWAYVWASLTLNNWQGMPAYMYGAMVFVAILNWLDAIWFRWQRDR